MKLKDWQLAALISAIVVVVAFVVTQRTGRDDVPLPEPLFVEEGAVLEMKEKVEVEEMDEETLKEYDTTQEACEAAGGDWDECASPCEGLDGEACITVCVEKCHL
jgi:hypothetical protein